MNKVFIIIIIIFFFLLDFFGLRSGPLDFFWVMV